MAASLILITHVATGTMAVLAGFLALVAVKGTQLHRMAGHVFVISMLVTSLVGGVVAFAIPDQFIALLGGVLACYLVITGTLAVRPRGQAALVATVTAFLFILATGVYLGSLGVAALTSDSGIRNGYSSGPYFFLAGVCLLAAGLDGAMLLRGGVEGRQRIARHLWRMCFGYFIAAGSLFTGPGSKSFPESIKATGILSAPEPLILLVMIFWLARVLWAKASPPQRDAR